MITLEFDYLVQYTNGDFCTMGHDTINVLNKTMREWFNTKDSYPPEMSPVYKYLEKKAKSVVHKEANFMLGKPHPKLVIQIRFELDDISEDLL